MSDSIMVEYEINDDDLGDNNSHIVYIDDEVFTNSYKFYININLGDRNVEEEIDLQASNIDAVTKQISDKYKISPNSVRSIIDSKLSYMNTDEKLTANSLRESYNTADQNSKALKIEDKADLKSFSTNSSPKKSFHKHNTSQNYSMNSKTKSLTDQYIDFPVKNKLTHPAKKNSTGTHDA